MSRGDNAQAGAPRALRILGRLAGMAIGGMLLYAGLLKAADPALFAEQIRGYKMLPAGMASLAAFGFIWVECLLGALLFLRLWPRWTLVAAAALLLLFIGATGWAWAHGNASACGCFGRLASRGPGEVILEDMLYLALTGFSFAFSPWRGGSTVPILAFGALAPLLVASPWIGPRLPVDSWITLLRPGEDLSGLAADDLRDPIGEGRVLVAFVGRECAACDAAVPVLDQIAQREITTGPESKGRAIEGSSTEGSPIEGSPVQRSTIQGSSTKESASRLRVTAVFAGDRKDTRAWVLEHVPAFPVGHTPERVLRQYYRRLPVFLLLEDGVIQKIWWRGVPEASEVVASSG